MHAGRKHQLRLHCAAELQAPVVGDSRYASARAASARQSESLQLGDLGFQSEEAEGAAADALQLHCRQVPRGARLACSVLHCPDHPCNVPHLAPSQPL